MRVERSGFRSGRWRRLAVDLAPLRQSRDFRYLWLGELVSETGSQVTLVAVFVQVYALTQSPAALVLEVNGQRFNGLASHRQVTRGCFEVFEDDNTPAAGNGFYVAIGPLKRGRYTLNFGGILPDLSQAVTYTIDVN